MNYVYMTYFHIVLVGVTFGPRDHCRLRLRATCTGVLKECFPELYGSIRHDDMPRTKCYSPPMNMWCEQHAKTS